LTRTIEAWHFCLIDPNFAVIDSQTMKCCENVLNHIDPRSPHNKRRLSRFFFPIADESRNPGMPKDVATDKDDSAMRRSGTELNCNILSRPKTEAGKTNAFGYRILIPKGFTDFLASKQ
jgi:hypothetical protein